MAPPNTKDYGAIPTHTVEEAEAEEGPFPVDLKSTLIAEFFGTCTLVQLGCAANCISLYGGGLQGSVQTGLAWGLSLTIAIYLSAALSGGHLNPAVSFSFALVRPADFRFRRLIPYWTAQFLGAIVAGCINLFLFHTAIDHYESKNKIVRGSQDSIQSAAAFGDYWSLNTKYVSGGFHAFCVEAFGTAVFFFVIFAATNPKNPIPGAAVPPIIGMTLAILVSILAPVTGYVNTKRSHTVRERLRVLSADEAWCVVH